MNLKTELLLDGLMFPEGPRWHQDKLWFTDQHARQIKTVDTILHAVTDADFENI